MALQYTFQLGFVECLWAATLGVVVYQVGKAFHRLYLGPLRHIPGPTLPAVTSLWIRWQRWQGQLSFTADDLLKEYGSIIRIAPNLVLVNDPDAVNLAFAKKNYDTAPSAIRALRVGGHDWTVTYPQLATARPRRHPVMLASTTKNLRHLRPLFEKYTAGMVEALAAPKGKSSMDIVRQLRIVTLYNSQVVIGGTGVQLDAETFPEVVGEYNFLVVWRLALPAWTFEWLKWAPWAAGRFRVASSDLLFKLGESLYLQAKETSGPLEDEECPNVYQLFTQREKGEKVDWNPNEMSAEMAGQILAATETTSSALAFIFYELAKNPALIEKLYAELQTVEGDEELDHLVLLDATIKEGLRFRPPVALTGSRLVGPGGIEIVGHQIPEGTVITTQALSICRQRPDLFPDADRFDPTRWMEQELLAERRRLLVPFGVGTRRCPGGNLAIYQMRMLIAAVVRNFKFSVPPETTPKSMAPFEANGFRSRHDECFLTFKPRGGDEAEKKDAEFGWCPCMPSAELRDQGGETVHKPAHHP